MEMVGVRLSRVDVCVNALAVENRTVEEVAGVQNAAMMENGIGCR